MKALLIILIVTAGAGCSVPAGSLQTGSISGAVTNAVTGEAMSGVVVTVGSDAQRSVTDDKGRFVIENVPEGAYTVSASKEGYLKASAEVTVEAGQEARLDLKLSFKPKPGRWSGFTNQEEKVSFAVAEDADSVEDFMITENLSCTMGTSTETKTISATVKVKDSKFEITISGGESYAGLFNSPTTAQGSWSNAFSIFLDSQTNSCSGSGSWSAVWVGS